MELSFAYFTRIYSCINRFYSHYMEPIKQVPTYESFVEGGKEGIKIAFSIIPFLVGMLVAISVFRASGALEALMNWIRPAMEAIGDSSRNYSPYS